MKINFKPIEIKGKMILSFFLGIGYLILVIKSIFNKKTENKIFELSNNISNSLSGNNQIREVKRIDSETSSE